MYGIFTNIYPINEPNVGKYSIHGAYGICYIYRKSSIYRPNYEGDAPTFFALGTRTWRDPVASSRISKIPKHTLQLGWGWVFICIHISRLKAMRWVNRPKDPRGLRYVPRVSVHSVSVHSLVLAFVDSFLHCWFFSLKQFPSHEMYGYDWGRARTIQNQNVDIFWGMNIHMPPILVSTSVDP